MDNCISSASIWFRLTFVAMAIYCIICLLKFIWGLCVRLPPPNLNKSKKRAGRRKKNKPNNVYSPEIEELRRTEALSEPLMKDTKDFSVKSARQFTYQSLADATQNFLLAWRLSVDGLGYVYRGEMVDTNEVFAIRRLSPFTDQSLKEFLDDVSLLSEANHPNLAKLIGYSFKNKIRLLVYEYEAGGSVEDLLYGNKTKTSLGWKMRMKIAFGVARALEYLQIIMKPPILHCYIQPSNIWLDKEWTPKLSAFGVVRMYPSSNRVDPSYETGGSYGYGLHDHGLTNKVTTQADVYGFGIFLLELITGRKPFLPEDDEETKLKNLEQPYFNINDGNLAKMVDPNLNGEVDNEDLYKAWNIAETCLQKQPHNRPPMSDVVKRIGCLIG